MGFVDALRRCSGQDIRVGDVLLYYSSSLAIEVSGKVLSYLSRRRVGLVHPTFDNIPARFRRLGLELVAIEEDLLQKGGSLDDVLDVLHALVIVMPNNPSGAWLSEGGFRGLLERCRARDVLVVLDFSFRSFVSDIQSWDQYAAARESGAVYMIIEDTGKTLPLMELKVGALSPHPSLRQLVETITDPSSAGVSRCAWSAGPRRKVFPLHRPVRGGVAVR